MATSLCKAVHLVVKIKYNSKFFLRSDLNVLDIQMPNEMHDTCRFMGKSPIYFIL